MLLAYVRGAVSKKPLPLRHILINIYIAVMYL